MQWTSPQSIFAERLYARNAREGSKDYWRIIWKNSTASKSSRTQKEIGNWTASDTRSNKPGNAFHSADGEPINVDNKNAFSVKT